MIWWWEGPESNIPHLSLVAGSSPLPPDGTSQGPRVHFSGPLLCSTAPTSTPGYRRVPACTQDTRTFHDPSTQTSYKLCVISTLVVSLLYDLQAKHTRKRERVAEGRFLGPGSHPTQEGPSPSTGV